MGHKLTDFTGLRRGKATIINNDYGLSVDGKRLVLCKCDCGSIFVIKRSTFLCDGFKGHCGCEKHRNSLSYDFNKIAPRTNKNKITNDIELSEHDKKILSYRNTCQSIKAWFLDLRSGKTNCNLWSAQYAE